MKRIWNFVLDLIYPGRCPVCHGIVEDTEKMICRQCFQKLDFVGAHYCMKCGRPVKSNEDFCTQCIQMKPVFTQGRSILLYNDVMKKSLVKFKYEGHREYGDFYAGLMYGYAGKQIYQWNPDLILPVPLHRKKLRVRGFNQAEYIAVRVGRKLGIPVSGTVLKKVRNTYSQKTLDAEKRKKNLQDAFEVCEDISGLKILVIDDVYTTGSTMNEIASLLTVKGAKKVYFLTICTGYN